MNELVNVAIANLPAVFALIREARKKADPNAPTPSDADVIAALNAAVAASVAKSDAWLALHGNR